MPLQSQPGYPLFIILAFRNITQLGLLLHTPFLLTCTNNYTWYGSPVSLLRLCRHPLETQHLDYLSQEAIVVRNIPLPLLFHLPQLVDL